MTTYYVRKDGADTNDGLADTAAGAWLTIVKALTIAGGGDTVNIGDGTYAENSAGANFLNVAKSSASWLVLQSTSGVAANVIITGNGSASGNTLINGATSHVRFRNLTFGMHATSATSCLRVNAASDNVDFVGVRFVMGDNSGRAIYASSASWAATAYTFTDCTTVAPAAGVDARAVDVGESGTGNVSNWTFTNCTLAGRGIGIYLYGVSNMTFTGCAISAAAGDGVWAGASPASITLTNCAVTATNCAYTVNGGTAWVVTGGTATNTGGYNCVVFGADGVSGNATTVTVTNLTVSHPGGVVGHALLMGAGCTSCVVDGVVVNQCNDYAIVLKEHTGTEVKNCTVTGGSVAAVYCKAAITPNIHHNTLRSSLTGSYVFQLLKGDTLNKNQGVTLRYNKMIAQGVGSLFNWGDATDDLGGGTCDYNTYALRTSGTFGNLRGTAGIASLAALRSAWAGYDVSGNDSHSKMWSCQDSGALIVLW